MREELKNMSETELNQLEEQVAEEAVTVEDIRSNLKQTKNGTPRQTIYNCLYVLRHDPIFGGAFRKNLMTGRTVVTKKMSVLSISLPMKMDSIRSGKCWKA